MITCIFEKTNQEEPFLFYAVNYSLYFLSADLLKISQRIVIRHQPPD